MAYLPMLAADSRGRLIELPEMAACGMAASQVFVLRPEELIPLPRKTTLFVLPRRRPIGFSQAHGRYQRVDDALAVAGLLPPGYVQALTAAYEERARAPILPLYTYAAVAKDRGRLYAAAVRVDRRRAHDMRDTDRRRLRGEIRRMRHSRNRLIRHLTHCAAVYCCPNAINFFLGRYECPLPVSPHCNARCQGCISRQPSGGPPASQARLTFVPTPEEIAEVALIHASRARNPIVSFGQGCEGEPLLQTGRIAAAIARIRRQSRRVTIHMNTNAGMPEAIAGLAQAGLDSIRVSVNSCRPVFYRRYVSPRGFGFQDVLRTIRLAKRAGLFVAINYLVMPGFTDQEPECKALLGFIETTRIDMVQWRNLNIDPRWFFRSLRVPEKERCIGIAGVMRRVAEAFPQVRQGYFNVFRVPAQERNGETGWQSIS